MSTVNLGRVGLVLKDDWDSATAYVPLDVVSHDGNSWAAKRNNTNVEPTTENSDDWQLISNNSDLVATVQGYKEDAETAAGAAAQSAADAETSAQSITKVIAPTEESSTASAAYSVGEYFIYNGKLYAVTAPIAQGDTITPGTNCQEVPDGISGEVSDLKSALEADENLQGKPQRVDISGWTLGRIISTGVQTNTKYAYSDTISYNDIAGKSVYFDAANYDLIPVYFDSADNDPTQGGYGSLGSTITSSPAVIPSARPYVRLMLKSAVDITVSNISVYYQYGVESALVSSVKDNTANITGLYGLIGKGSITPPAYQAGYYIITDNVIEFVAQDTSKAYIIDLTDYIGHVITIHMTTNADTSVRKSALCDSQGNVSQYVSEGQFVSEYADAGFSFFPTEDYYMLYISYSQYASNLVIDDFSGLYGDIAKLENSVFPSVVYVDGSVVSTGDGTSAAPYATIGEGIASGAETVRIKAVDGNGDPIEYGAFAVTDRNRPLRLMLWDMPDYVASATYQDTPKILIHDTVTYHGVTITNCADVYISDMWVHESPRYPFNIIGVQKLEMVRCYADANSTENFSAFRLVNVNGVFRDCKAWNCRMDGFNIHGFGDTQFINCVGYNNGDDGISHHDSCTGCIIGGEYYGNGKAGIASPFGGARVDVSGAYCHNNTRYGLYADSNDSHPSIYARVSDCLFVDNAQADVYVADGTVVSWNTLYKTKSIQATATFTEYNNTVLT